MKRWFLVLLILLSLSAVFPLPEARADKLGDVAKTAVAISHAATPIVLDCMGMDAYVESLKGWYTQEAEVFQQLGLEDFEGLSSLSPPEMAALAASFHEAAGDLEQIVPPPVALPYHERLITEVHILANAIADMPTLGVVGSLLFYFGSITPEAGELTTDEWEAVLAQQCNAFADYLEWRESSTWIAETPAPSATPNRLDGTVTLVGSTAVEIRTSSPREPGTVCQGTGLYSDVRAKTQLRLQDDTGRVLGTGTLGHGAYSVGADTEPRCTFSFFVSQVPAHPSYTITIGTRVVFTFTFEELQASGWTVALTLG